MRERTNQRLTAISQFQIDGWGERDVDFGNPRHTIALHRAVHKVPGRLDTCTCGSKGNYKTTNNGKH